MHGCFPKQSFMGNARIKKENDTEEEGKKRRANMENSTASTKRKKSQRSNSRSGLPSHRVRYSPKQWVNNLTNLTQTHIYISTALCGVKMWNTCAYCAVPNTCTWEHVRILCCPKHLYMGTTSMKLVKQTNVITN